MPLISRRVTLLACVCTAVLVVLAAASAARAADPVPRPCFVPPPPQKQGVLTPREQTDRTFRSRIPVGGAAFDYRDDHLHPRPAGVQGAAQGETRRVLALLVDFDDQVMGEASGLDSQDLIQRYFGRVMMFLDQTYEQMSDGLFDIDYTISSNVYRMPRPMFYYGLDDSIATRQAKLCEDAVQAADADIDFTQFDTVILFHAGQGQEADINDDSREQIWSVFFRQIDFEFWLDAPDSEFGIRTDDPNPGGGGAPYYVPNMVIAPELESQDGFEFGILGVVAHEFGHSFGLPDLYDTTAPDDFIFADSQGIGTFGLMGAGIWNDNGRFPSEMCAWSRFYIGWLQPEVLQPEGGDPGTIDRLVQLDAIQLARRTGAVRIPMGGDEYFLIENRIRDYNGNGTFDFDDFDGDKVFDFWDDSYAGAEYDWFLTSDISTGATGPPDNAGLLIWHIDESIVREFIRFNLVNAEALHKGIDLEEADGIQDLDRLEFTFEAFGDENDAWFSPNATEFTPTSLPNSDGYFDVNSGIRITEISDPGDLMSFRLAFRSASGNERGDIRPGWPVALGDRTRDFQPTAGDLDGDGVQELVAAATAEDGTGGVRVLRLDGTPYQPGSTPAGYLQTGPLRSDPILVDVDGAPDGRPEIVWVSGNVLYVWKGSGVFLDEFGNTTPAPAPYYTLAVDPGRCRLAAADLVFFGDDRAEILFPEPSATEPGTTDLVALGFVPGTGAVVRARISLPASSLSAPVLADLDGFDDGLRELVVTGHTDAGSFIAVGLLREFLPQGQTEIPSGAVCWAAPDSVRFGPPVVGDLDRDGDDEIVFTDSEGRVHALTFNIGNDGQQKQFAPGKPQGTDTGRELFGDLAGWPVDIGALGDDEVSLADVDGDELLEVLAFGPVNRLYEINYNGVVELSLPVAVPSEERFTVVDRDIFLAPYFAPMVLDLDDRPGPDLLLPMQDGQARGHDTQGRPLDDWALFSGGNQLTYPVVDDLDGDGTLELVSVEDIAVALPDPGLNDTGDESDLIQREGRLVIRYAGTGSAEGPWPRYRVDAARSGRVAAPTGAVPEPAGGAVLSETFVMPNPAVAQETAGFHYRINSGVSRVMIEIFTARGVPVRTLDGTVDAGVNNVVRWDLTNEQGNGVAPGLYVARVQAEDGSRVDVQTINFVVVR